MSNYAEKIQIFLSAKELVSDNIFGIMGKEID
jgi:hypothetical protein